MSFEESHQSSGHGDNKSLRHAFWRKIKRVGLGLPFIEDLLAAYFCSFDGDTPARVRFTLVGALAYFVLPVDAIPDLLPVAGFTDDAAVLALAIKSIADHLKPAHSEAARRLLEKHRL